MARDMWVAGNWKMNGSLSFVRSLLQDLIQRVDSQPSTKVLVFPPAIYLPMVSELLKGTSIQWGAQNLSEHDEGAYTGEISGAMLREFGCQYVIVGHSERRSLYHETNQQVAEKFRAAQRHGLKPILCVGETLQQREQEQTLEVVLAQLNAVIKEVGVDALSQGLVAYEPVWAIGTGLTASPQQAQEVHQALRQAVATHSEKAANLLPILYGGSVKPDNVAELFAMPDIDGGLIGGASLKSADFLAIIEQANKVEASWIN
jgi:triosephosphate isomerase